MYFKPLLPDGREVSLPWRIKILYFNMAWPLKDNPSKLVQFFGYLTISFGFSIYLIADEGEILFFIKNLNDINLCLEALVTFVALNECILRIFNMVLTKNKFKSFLKEFFLHIYTDEKTDTITWKRIRRGLIPATIYSYTYILTTVCFQIAPFLQFKQNKRTLPYKISLHYDLDKPAWYGLTLLYLNLTGATLTFFLIGEVYLVASFILHLNARYVNLQRDIQKCSQKLLWTVPPSRLAAEFRKRIIVLNKENCKLDRFAGLLERIHNFRIFVIISFSAVMLCGLAVQVASLGQKSTKNFAYVFWIIAKISELILFGTLGSTLIQTTDRMSSSYYLSNWETIIYRSTNTKENIRLMKDLQIMMSLHRNSKRLSGYKFFDVSLYTVITVLRGAFSYFTCLYTIKQSEEN